MSEVKWIVPPGLMIPVDEIQKLYEHLKTKPGRKIPIMILGDRGTGKSLFLRIYQKLFEKDNPGAKIQRLNISAVSEKIIESELFGHVKGAFTDAIKDKQGFVEDVDLLILEEIGELPWPIQAKLLTFIEDGKYYRVGDTNPLGANEGMQILCTTNKPKKDIRPDFYDRFLKFKVPALYERRGDVLYYIASYSPELLPHFYHWEIMTLMAHPWPGNVRELQAVCLDMEMFHLQNKASEEEIGKEFAAFMKNRPAVTHIREDQSSLQWDSCRNRWWSLKNAGIDVKLLEKVLNQYHLGIDPTNRKKPWRKNIWDIRELTDEDRKRDEIFGVKTLRSNEQFDALYHEGLLLFSCLFLKSQTDPGDLLSVRSGQLRFPFMSPLRLIKNPTPKHDQLVKSLIEYVIREPLPSHMKEMSILNMNQNDYDEWFVQHATPAEPESDRQADMAVPKDNPFDMKEDELLKKYYSYHLKKAKGNKSAASRAVGIPYMTFCDALKRLELP